MMISLMELKRDVADLTAAIEALEKYRRLTQPAGTARLPRKSTKPLVRRTGGRASARSLFPSSRVRP